MKKYLSIDIGGTYIKYSVMDDMFQVLESKEERTHRNAEELGLQLTAIAKNYKDTVQGIAVCMAGFINPETGENTDFSVHESFRAFNVREKLQIKRDMPVLLENDSNCALLGEMQIGAGRGKKNVFLLTIGTGIGGAVAIDGRLYRGSHFKAGEAGFLQIQENVAGATSVLVKEISAALHKEVDGKYIFSHLENATIQKIYEDWMNRLVPVVGNCAVLLDPEAVLIGGGISVQKRFLDDLRKKVYECFPHLEEYTEIKECETGNMAGRIGALALLKERFKL